MTVSVVLEQIFNGVSIGMVYALIALGYTMVYGILRMINFSHGEVFMIGGFVGWLTISGLLAAGAPPIFIVLAALIAAILFCGALGYAIERIAYRPLRNARSVGVIISGLGVSLILQTSVLLIFGARFKLIETAKIIPNAWYITLGDIRISFTRVLIVVVALALMIALDHFVRKTRWGKATRATAQDIEAAAFMGVNVDRVVSLIYILGSALAGVGGVLLGLLYTQVDFTFGFFIGLKAFTAAVIGGIGNIRGALLGGLILGVAESLAAGLISPTYKDVTTFVLLALVLLIRPTGILGKPMRIREVLTTRPSGGRPNAVSLWMADAAATLRAKPWGRHAPTAAMALGAALILAMPFLLERPYHVRVGAAIGLAVMMVASLNVVTGWTGLLSLGHIGFYAVGAYVYAFVASAHFGVHLPFGLALSASAGAAALLGLFIGVVSLRLRGDYLAMVTLAFAEIVRNLIISLDRPINLTGGVNGILNLDAPWILGVEIVELRHFYYLIWIAALVVLLALSQLRSSRVGRAWLSIREDEVAAGSLGVHVFAYKLLAFTFSAALAGAAGAIFASWQGSVFPEGFTVEQTAIMFCMLVVGGAAGAPGLVLGAALLTIVPELLRDYGVYRMLLFGLLLVLAMRYRPQGLFQPVARRSTASSVGSTIDLASPKEAKR
jgi:branched-chain amino acid transport system permease protein